MKHLQTFEQFEYQGEPLDEAIFGMKFGKEKVIDQKANPNVKLFVEKVLSDKNFGLKSNLPLFSNYVRSIGFDKLFTTLTSEDLKTEFETAKNELLAFYKNPKDSDKLVVFRKLCLMALNPQVVAHAVEQLKTMKDDIKFVPLQEWQVDDQLGFKVPTLRMVSNVGSATAVGSGNGAISSKHLEPKQQTKLAPTQPTQK